LQWYNPLFFAFFSANKLLLIDLAVLYARLDRLLEAEQLYKRALAIRRIVVGENHPDTAQAIKNLASNLQDQGKLGEAVHLFQQYVAM